MKLVQDVGHAGRAILPVDTSFLQDRPAFKFCLKGNSISKRSCDPTQPSFTHCVVRIQIRQSRCLVVCGTVTMMKPYFAPTPLLERLQPLQTELTLGKIPYTDCEDIQSAISLCSHQMTPYCLCPVVAQCILYHSLVLEPKAIYIKRTQG